MPELPDGITVPQPGPLPNDQQVTFNQDIGDTELEQWLTSIGDGAEITLPSLEAGKPQPPITAETDPTGGEEDDDDDDETSDDDPQGTPNGFFDLGNGNRISREDAQRLYDFDQHLRSNPEVARRVSAAAAGPAVQPPVSETPPPTSEEFKAPEPPDYLDLEDPAQKFTWDTHVATQKALFDRDQRDKQLFSSIAQQRQQDINRQAAQDMVTALDKFKQEHPNLNEDDIAKIRSGAGPFIQPMMAQLPPVDALVRSMEISGRMDTDLLAKMTDPAVTSKSTKQTARHRKARLGEISGSPRSAPKTEQARPAFTSDKEFLNALAAEFSEQMQR